MSMDRIIPLLGSPTFSCDAVEVWQATSRNAGMTFPEHFREFCDAYGPGRVNSVRILHPVYGQSLLFDRVRATVAFLGPLFDRGDLPAPLGWLEGQLLPFGHEISGVELLFRVTESPANDWHVCAFAGGEFEDFEFGFEEWLYRYLVGDEVLSPWLSGCGELPPRFLPAT
jgi:hypothetical protein